MFYEETKKISSLFTWAIILTVVIGIVGGFYAGNALSVPTEEAIEAMEEIAENPFMASLYSDEAAKTEWKFASVIAMISIWVLTFIACVLLYEKKCKMEILDDVARKLNNIEQQTKEVE